MSGILNISIKLVMVGIVAFAALILLSFAGFLAWGVLQFGVDPVSAGYSVVGLGLVLIGILVLGALLLRIVK